MSISALSTVSLFGSWPPDPRIGAGPPRRANTTPCSADGDESQAEPANGEVPLAAGRPRPEAVDDTLELSSDAQVLEQLSDEEQRVVERLKARDREVRAHEQAHLSAAAGNATGGPQFETTTGPDGRQYAVGGEVGIDTSPVQGDPEATIRKAQIIRSAAMAPANPSSQDMRVASQASKMEMDARAELRRKEQAEREQAAGAEDASQPPSEQDTARVPFDVYA